jgi:rhodanese-related sulfurtransferase
MKRVFFFVILGVFVVLTACANTRTANEVRRISKEELKAKLGSPDVVILDVRIKGDWEASDEKITGAIREDPQSVNSWASTLPKDKQIVLYCA